jgi:hypothetical protein
MLANGSPTTANADAVRTANANVGTPQFVYAAQHQQPRRVMQ